VKRLQEKVHQKKSNDRFQAFPFDAVDNVKDQTLVKTSQRIVLIHCIIFHILSINIELEEKSQHGILNIMACLLQINLFAFIILSSTNV
jgi:hypothetical protein